MGKCLGNDHFQPFKTGWLFGVPGVYIYNSWGTIPWGGRGATRHWIIHVYIYIYTPKHSKLYIGGFPNVSIKNLKLIFRSRRLFNMKKIPLSCCQNMSGMHMILELNANGNVDHLSKWWVQASFSPIYVYTSCWLQVNPPKSSHPKLSWK